MIPKKYKVLRKSQRVPAVYIRYIDVCGTSRPDYIGETENMFGDRPRRNDSNLKTWSDIRLLESVSNPQRRKCYEASLIIKVEPLSQRIEKNVIQYKKYFHKARRAGLLNMELKHDRWRKILAWSCYKTAKEKLDSLLKIFYNINEGILRDYHNDIVINNIELRKWKRPGYHAGWNSITTDNMTSKFETLRNLSNIISFYEDLETLKKYFKKHHKYLIKFERMSNAAASLLRLSKPKHGIYGKFVDQDINTMFRDICETTEGSFCKKLYKKFKTSNTHKTGFFPSGYWQRAKMVESLISTYNLFEKLIKPEALRLTKFMDKKELKEVLKADNYASYLPVTHDETQKYRGGYEPEELY